MKNSFLFLLLVAWLCVLPAQGVEQQSNYNVLLIQSYNQRSTWHERLTEGLNAGLKEGGVSANILVEYLDADYWTVIPENIIMQRICDRARKQKVDLIVTVGDEAYYTLMHCGDSLPFQLPVVISGVKYTPDKALAYPNVCGHTSRGNFLTVLEESHRLFPSRTEVICLIDNGTVSKLGHKQLEAVWPEFYRKHPEYTLTVLNASEEGLRSVASICYDHSAYNRTVVAPKWSNLLSFLGRNSKAPIFAMQSDALGSGAFSVLDVAPYNETFASGTIAAKLLTGAEPSDFGISNMSGQLVYDYKQLEYFHVDIDAAHPHGQVLNVPASVKYRFWMILAYIATVAVALFLIISINRMRRRESRRRAYAQTRLLIQNRLVEQRNEFDNIFNSIRDGLVTYDTDLHIHFINHSMMFMLDANINDEYMQGYEGKDAGSIFALYVNGENVLPTLLSQARDERQLVVIPENAFIQVRASGNYFPISGEIVPIYSGGKLNGIAICCRNISEEEMNRRFFKLALEASSVFPWSFDIHSKTYRFSDNFINYFHLSDNVISAQQFNAMINPEDLPGLVEKYTAVCRGQLSDLSGDFRILNSHGKYEWVNIHCIAYKGFVADDPYMVLGVCQSIQAHKDAEEELIVARDRALQADKLKSAFLANMSHEIRTPLNSIVGFSDLLRDFDAFSHDEVTQFIDTINTNCTLLLALISDILDLARIEAGSMDFHFADYNLSFIMQQIYDSQRLNMPSGVELQVEIPTGDGKVISIDNVRLKQVINNLINNAKKFTSQGYIKFGYTTERSGYTAFFVEDTGSGISEENQRRIFERFYKVDSFTQGAGLGLSICQTIVDRFGGKIDVASQRGKGTRFTVRVPNTHEEHEE
ncbi:MAG: histidine kinase [Prevotellaceae bacterium]|jgi:signal transduction histidine kinase/ABC-type uncharacterized transport system substrate-binding protein|nr:histidine kinase [Prevotellaceae bacterium]